MQVWFTAQQTAHRWRELGLADLPHTKMGVWKLIEREGWRERVALCRPATGIEGGGGWLFHLEQWQLFARIAHVVRDFRLTAADLILRRAGGSVLNEAGAMPLYAGPDPRHGALVAGSGALLRDMAGVIAATAR